MKTLPILILLFYSILHVGAQEDPKSQKILDDLAVRFKSYPGISVDFSASVTQLQDKSESVYQGKLWLKGNRYKLELPNNIIYFDTQKIYQYMPDVKEVNVTLPADEEDGDLQLLSPQTIFNLSSKNFKSKLVKENTLNGRKVYEIDLYPVQVKTSKYSRVRLCVEKETLQIVSVRAFFKDGAQYLISLSKYHIQQSLPDSFFTFNTSQHPDVEVIDLTF